jgi:CrcB protein
MRFVWQYLAVGIAGAAGAIARVAVGQFFQFFFSGVRFPVATMFINVGGSLFLGWFYTVASERVQISDMTRIAIGAGFVGAYTTFSTLMYDSAKLAEEGQWIETTLNIFLSLLLGLLAVRAGMMLARLRIV